MEKTNFKVSIIMPVYNVERYLRGCLDSVTSQTLKEVEIIVVNDGSTDNSLSILQEYERKFPDQMRVFTTENRGVSHARNYGLRHASGEFVLFVDSDDFIEEDMCEKLYQKAVQDGNDIVVCGRYNVYEREAIGQVIRKPTGTHLINRNFKLAEHKYELAHISPFPWDKLFRRSLLEGMAFPENIRFEDLALIFQVVCKAQSIGVVEEPLYNYRRTTQGGFLNSFSKQTLDIITAFELVFDFMKKNNLMDLYYSELEYICARHFLYRYGSLFKRENKGKLDIKVEIIKKTQDFLDSQLPSWRNNHYLKYSSGALKEKLWLYTNKGKMLRMTYLREYTPHFVVKIAAKLRDFLAKWKRRWNKFKTSRNKVKLVRRKLPLLSILAQRGSVYYTRMYEKLAVDSHLILFESKHGEDVAGNIFALLKELTHSRYETYRILLAMEPTYMGSYSRLLEKYNLNHVAMIEIRSKEYMRALASAKYLITDTSFPPYFIKKKEQVYLNTWHGTPLKAMGRIVPAREYALGNVQRNFLIADYLLYQNDFSKDVFQEDYMIKNIYPGKMLVAGYPRNSVFCKPDRYQQIRKECGLSNKQVIVYMPTWRGLLHKKETAKQLERLGVFFTQIDKSLTSSQVFYVKLHPFVKNELDYSGFKHIKEFPAGYETYDFLNASDALVTDYSSIMFDYGVTGRKIILFTYDREEYADGRGLYFDLESLELPKVETVEELIEGLNSGKKAYPDFQAKFCSYDSLDTPRQVMETLLFGQTEIKDKFKVEQITPPAKKKVLVFIRSLKDDDYTHKLINTINGINTDRYDVYVSMKAGGARKNTHMLSLLRKEINYIPITYEVNYTRSDYILSKLYLKFGIGNGNRMDQILKREIQKYYGDVQFDYVIHQSEFDRMVGHMCSLMADTTVYNFKYFDYEKYKDNRKYRKQVRYFLKRFPLYTLVVATKEFDLLKKKANNIYYNEEALFPMKKILREVTQHEGRSHNISQRQ